MKLTRQVLIEKSPFRIKIKGDIHEFEFTQWWYGSRGYINLELVVRNCLKDDLKNVVTYNVSENLNELYVIVEGGDKNGGFVLKKHCQKI